MTTTEPEIEAELAAEVSSRDEPESFGTWLRCQREVREITLREIADTSKISIRYLQALEENRFDLLPAAVFAKGFLRQYARYVGLDPEEAVNFFLAASGHGEEEQADAPRRPPQTLATRLYAVLAVVAAIVLMAVVWGLTRLNRGQTEEPFETPPAPASVAPGGGRPAAGEAEASATESDGAAPVEGEPEAVTGDEPGSGPAGSGLTASGPAALVVTVDFRGDCWVQAAIDGEAQESRVFVQGESVQLEAKEAVDLKLGNIFVTDVEVNGRPLTFEGGASAVRELRIDLETAAALAASEGSADR